MANVNKRIVYRNMESNDQIENFVNERVEKIEHLISTEPTPKTIDLVITKEHSGVVYKAELHVVTPGYKLYTSREGEDIYKQVDEALEVMLDAIRIEKDKNSDKRKKSKWFKSS